MCGILLPHLGGPYLVRRSTNLHAMLKKLWNDPVWSKVIAGAILAVGTLLGTYFLDWWPTIGRFAKDAYNFALSPTSLLNWIIGVLGLLAAPTIIGLLAIIWQRYSHPHQALQIGGITQLISFSVCVGVGATLEMGKYTMYIRSALIVISKFMRKTQVHIAPLTESRFAAIAVARGLASSMNHSPPWKIR